MSEKLLIFGARKKSLGNAVHKMWSDMYDTPVLTVGVSGEEMEQVVMTDSDEISSLIREFQPTKIVVTTGVNEELGDKVFEDWMMDHFYVNVYLPMQVLMCWIEVMVPEDGHFVAISSNSAHIPRSKSMAYGASKAALSMALRCAARDVAKAGIQMSVYGYEPGLIKGTPMSGERGGTRMLGAGVTQGISRRALAGQIVHNLAFGGPEQNGVLYRVDAGEV